MTVDAAGNVITAGHFEGAVDLTGEAGNTVYFRAYATNSAGTGYSDVQSFIPADAPDVTVAPAVPASITFESAILGGEVTSENGAPVTDRGIVWNTTNTWNVSNPPALEGTVWAMGSGPGTFSDTVTGLPSNTVIHYKAYAINSSGTSYSQPSPKVRAGINPKRL